VDEIRFVAPQISATRCALTKSTMSADQSADSMPQTDLIRLFLCGDVMTGRGIDQLLPHPNDPALHEPCIDDARFYLKLAESVNGAITRPVTAEYIWGDALAELNRAGVDLRIINLETSITSSEHYWRHKEILYRMPSAQHRLHHRGAHRLLLPREQSYPRLGLRRSDRDTAHARRSGHRAHGRGTRRRRGCCTRGA
jgi:Bacterial capsule synthesis protein PGA_cap